jgi:short-subunit dehydrogenase
MELTGKTVLLTGASRGIGVYIAGTLAKQGARVIGVARSREGLEQTRFKVEAAGEVFYSIPFDLTQTGSLADLVSQAHDQAGPIDILVHNAGVELYQYYQANTAADLEKIVRTNLLAPLELTRLILPEMLERGGHIVTIASLAGKKGVAYNSIYSATKAGLIMWCDALRQELAASRVNISVICPGYISTTGMFHDGGVAPPPLLGTSSPQDVADAVVTAITENRAEVIVNKGPMKPLLALGQISPTLGDRVVRWFGVPELSRKRIRGED